MISECKYCGAKISEGRTCQDLYNELSLYTLAHPDPYFIHQHVVDAYAVQHAKGNKKPLKTVSGLVGLYFFVVHDYSGKKIQRVHMEMGNKMKEWPPLIPPETNTKINVGSVLSTPAGPERDGMIKEWARSVWDTWEDYHPLVENLVKSFYKK